MSQPNKKKIIKNILEIYSGRPGVLGMVVFGSFVRGKFDKYSDIDVYVLEVATPRFARESYTLGGVRIDVTIDSKKDAQELLKKERRSVHRVFSHMLAHGEIVYANGEMLKKLQKSAVTNLKEKTTYTRDEIIMHLYSIEDFYGEALRFFHLNDKFAFEQSVSLLVNNIIECFLKLKGEYLRRPNELASILKAKDPVFWKDLRAVFLSKNELQKVKNLTKLVKKIETLTNGPLPEKWAVR